MSNAGMLTLLKLIQKRGGGVKTEDKFEEMYPRPFTDRSHFVALAVAIWCALMAVALILTL